MALSSWIDIYDTILLNLDNVGVIERMEDNKTRIYLCSNTDEATSIIAPISYDSLRDIINTRRTFELNEKKSFKRVLNTLNKSASTPTP